MAELRASTEGGLSQAVRAHLRKVRMKTARQDLKAA